MDDLSRTDSQRSIMNLSAPDFGFLGAPIHSDLSTLEADFAFLGIPHGSPSEMRDVFSEASKAPAALRDVARRHGLLADTEFYDFDLGGPLLPTEDVRLVDCGDVQGDPRDLEATKQWGTEAIQMILNRGTIPLVIGGDDSIPPIVLRAFEGREPLNVLQVDAHLDFRDELMGVHDGYASPMRRVSEMAWVDRIFQVGLRGAGSSRAADVEAALACGNILITANDVHENSAQWVLNQLPIAEPWFITIDCDGLDPTIAPGTGYPLPGGLSFCQVQSLIEGLTNGGRVAGIAVTEHYPSLDVRSLTAITITRLFMVFIGLSARVAKGRERASTGSIIHTRDEIETA